MTDQPARRSVRDRRTSRAADVLPLDRFNAFTDGVFAIAITLLVLELSVPAAGVRLLPALAEQWQEFLGYLISFAFIGGIWVSHAGMTKLMRHADTLAYGIDLLMLLFVGLLPFSTNLLVTHLSGPDVEAAVVIYGINVLLASLALSLLMFYIASERSLVRRRRRRRDPGCEGPSAVDRDRPECRCHRPRRRGAGRCRRGVPRHDVPCAGPPADPPSSAPAIAKSSPDRLSPIAAPAILDQVGSTGSNPLAAARSVRTPRPAPAPCPRTARTGRSARRARRSDGRPGSPALCP